MRLVNLWRCKNYGVNILERSASTEDMIEIEIATGLLHEICLINDLDIPDLEAEQDG